MSKNLEKYIENYGSIFWSVNHSNKIYTGGEEKELFFLIKSIKNKNQKTILDVGGGNGYSSRILCKFFKKVINLDINKSLIEQSRQINKNNTNVGHINKNFLKSGIKSKSINVVMIFNTFQYIDASEYEIFIKEISRILKKEGIAIFNYSDPKKIKKTFKKILLEKLSNIKKNYRNFSLKNFYLFIKYFLDKNTISNFLNTDIKYFEKILKKEKIHYKTIKYYHKTHYVLEF